MTKKLIVDPAEVRSSDSLDLGEIPINVYSKALSEEIASNSAVTPAQTASSARSNTPSSASLKCSESFPKGESK